MRVSDMKSSKFYTISALLIVFALLMQIEKNSPFTEYEITSVTHYDDASLFDHFFHNLPLADEGAEILLNVGNADRPLAIVRRFKPQVRVRDSQQPEWVEAQIAQQLFDRDTLRTDADGYAVVQLIDNSLARVRPNSMLIIRGEANERGGLNTRINVESGSMNLNVAGRQSEYEVATPTAVAAVKGTQFITELSDDGTSTFTCFSGEVAVTASNSGREVTLRQRRRAVVDNQGNTIRTSSISAREQRNLLQLEEDMESSTAPKRIRIRLRNADGQEREIEIPYYDRENN
jgi:hypothetical protein